ncbi:carboxylesterase/lipase family protein [Nocardia aurea]|uniref:Carboxylic ester hydrolase n=1 Tax=Nocardia aurea TaxID=2144174 RepID=A0ABV3FXG6_9NOCA
MRFAGVPYAAPPVGDLRWRAPRAPQKWEGVRDALDFGDSCTQFPTLVGGREDCLYLNVYAPARPRHEKLPVLVWVHGGSYVLGSAATYDPAAFVRGGEAIVVSFNYRMGVLGALALPELDDEEATGSGAYTLLDQQAALRWVQHNIDSFGGDSDRVMLFGQSSGAGYTCMNLASPSAAGLFHTAVTQSGCAQPSPSLPQARDAAVRIADRLGCAAAAISPPCLRAKTPAELNDAASAVLGGFQNLVQTLQPPYGTKVYPSPVAHALSGGAYNKVPLIVGSNRREGQLLAGTGLFGFPIGRQQYLDSIRTTITYLPPETVAEQYPLAAYPQPLEALAAIVGDSGFACPALAIQSAASRSQVYGYTFTDPDAPGVVPIVLPPVPTHGSELSYLFELPATAVLSPAQRNLSDTMIDYWIRFAATGVPDGVGLPHWPAFDAPDAAIQNLSPGAVGPTPATDFAAEHHCDFWNSVDAYR